MVVRADYRIHLATVDQAQHRRRAAWLGATYRMRRGSHRTPTARGRKYVLLTIVWQPATARMVAVPKIDLAHLELPRERRWEHRNDRYPTEAIVLRQTGDIVAASPNERRRPRGVGVWDLSTGRLLWWSVWGDYVRFLASGMIACVDWRIVRYRWPDLTELDSTEAPDQAEEFVVAPSERMLVVYQNSGQGENGYQVFSLDEGFPSISRKPGLSTPPMYVPPVFSPSERQILCAPGTDGCFWVPDEEHWPADWDGEEVEIPSIGGPAKFGDVLVHDLETDVITRHELRYELDPGWVPEDCEDGRWNYGPIGLEFPAEDRIRLRQPDSTWIELTLPLPRTVLLPTPSRVLPPYEEGR